MIVTYLLQFMIAMVSALFFFLPNVSTLPFGIDGVLVIAMGWIHGLLYSMPFLQITWTLFLSILGLKLLVWTIHLVKWIWSVIRG